tara:strand:- start:117 stop:617 length:501 start_codon:yes stop_codon:yes gene_type:complete
MEVFNKIKKTTINTINISFNNVKENPHLLILPILLIILFSIIGYILFSKNIKKILNKHFVLNREFINKSDNNNNNITIIYFYTEWCPYCKKSKPEWNKFKELVNLQEFNKSITFEEIDCDKNPEIANNYKIEGYPTIKLIYNGEVYDFDAKPESNILLEFVQSIIT